MRCYEGPGRPAEALVTQSTCSTSSGRVAACSDALIWPMRSFGSPPPRPWLRLHPLGRWRSRSRGGPPRAPPKTSPRCAGRAPRAAATQLCARGLLLARPALPAPKGRPQALAAPPRTRRRGSQDVPRAYGGRESPGRAKECRETPGKGVVWASPRLPGLLNTATPPIQRRRPGSSAAPRAPRTPTPPRCSCVCGGASACLSACLPVCLSACLSVGCYVSFPVSASR